MKWTAYTDGACAPSNPGPAGWGAVVIAPDGRTETDHYGFIGHGTNQIAELTAAAEGLSRVPEGAEVELVSDSQYVLKGLMEWRTGWERRGFRNAKGEAVANLALWKKVVIVLSAMTIEEFFFRSFLQKRIGLIASTLLFALAHFTYGNPLMLIGVTVISLVIAITFYRTKNVVPGILAHGVFDAIQLFVIVPIAVKMMGLG